MNSLASPDFSNIKWQIETRSKKKTTQEQKKSEKKIESYS